MLSQPPAPRVAIVLAVLLVVACGGSPTVPTPGNNTLGGATPSGRATGSGPGTGTLPDSGAQARIVNLYADENGTTDLDVFGYGGSDIVANEVRVATVSYGAVSDWFDPGYVQDSSGQRGTSSIGLRRPGEQFDMTAYSDASVVPGVRLTVLVPPHDNLGIAIQGIYEEHPERQGAPAAPAGLALLVTNYNGLADDELASQTYHASVGDGCLNGKLFDPSLGPLPQPIGSELTVEPGSYELTIHVDEAAGQIATCASEPIASAPLEVSAGDRVHVLLYSLPGETAVHVLVLPFGE